MKVLKYILIAVLTISAVSCKEAAKKQSAESVNGVENLVTANLNIKGMTCEIGCAKTIESKISKLEGVKESNVNFEAKKGVFTYDANKTSEDEIVNTINNLLDGKTYSAIKGEKECKTIGEKKCCTVKEKTACAKACAEKCEGEKKECKADCEKPCCVTKK